MTADSEASRPAVKPDGRDAASPNSRWKQVRAALKYILLVVIVGSWIVGALLSFVAPLFVYHLVWVDIVCLLVLFCLFLGALFRRRWKEVAVFFIIWAVVLLPYYGSDAPLRQLVVLAFRVHVSPVDEYLSRCKLIEFVENGATQAVGVCETTGLGNETYRLVIYDTTGEIALPASRKTPEWTEAMMRFRQAKLLVKSEDRVDHLFGHFYRVAFSDLEDDGNNSGY